ncbi:hypothetical protein K8R61_01360 [bacterium]|nr:hypothetical protein [bacterium]
MYPLQAYPFFEHSLSQEFKDAMAALMEILASLRKGENVWLQYVVTMEGFGWVGKCKREINKVVGKDSGGNGGFLKQISKFFSDFVFGITGQISGSQETVTKKENGKNEALMLKLTPGEVDSIKAIENKMGKIGFNVKMRLIYFAPNDVYTPPRSVSATVGALKQFAGPFNGFKPESKRTRTKKFLVFSEKRLASRQRKILNAYKTRSNDLGVGNGFILNSEELATVFHFPDSTSVKTSLVKKVASKKFEPPMNLPIE